jgi:hypothetical protein
VRRFPSLVTLFLILPRIAFAQIDDAQFSNDLHALTSSPTRVVGSDGYAKAVAYLEQQIRALPNIELQRHDFPLMVPVTTRATLRRARPDAKDEPIYPFWPASVRTSSTPPQGIKGHAIYCGHLRPAEVRPGSLSGNIAVIEASVGEDWSIPAQYGAVATIVLGTRDTSHVDLRSHELQIPVNFPRFYVPPGALADALRSGAITEPVTIHVTVTWKRASAANLYALVKPQQSIANWTQSLPPAALMVSVPFDASSLVPDLAPGASQAVQTAAGLALLRDIAAHPWPRPVVLAFTGGDSMNMLATRNLCLAFAEAPALWRKEIAELDGKSKELSSELTRAREVLESPQILRPSTDRELLTRIIRTIETDATLEQDELFRIRTAQPEEHSPELIDRQKQLEQRQLLLNRLRFTLQKDPRRLEASDLLPIARHYVERTIQQISGAHAHSPSRPPGAPRRAASDTEQIEGLLSQHAARRAELTRRIDLYHWLASATGRLAEPDERQTDNRLIELLVALDLSDRGAVAGPMYYGSYQRLSNIAQVQDYLDWLTRTARAHEQHDPKAKWWGEISSAITLAPLAQMQTPPSFLVAPLAIGSEVPRDWGIPAFSLVTFNDLRLRRDTPTDTLDRIDTKTILPQLRGTRELLSHAWSDPTFVGPVELKRWRNDLRGQVVSSAPGEPVPNLPRSGFLATYFHVERADKKIPPLRQVPWTLGLRRLEVRDCDDEGNYLFEGLPTLQPEMQLAMAQVFRLNPGSGAIISATDLGKQSADIKPYADLRLDLDPLRSVVFNCEEFSLAGLYDPRYLQSLGEVLPLDARRNDEPQRFNMCLDNQMLMGLVEPGARSILAFRYGRVGNRVLLLNESASGFSANQLRSLGPIPLVTARDFWRLDETRLEDYRRAGVSSDLIDTLHNESADQIASAEKAQKADQGAPFMRDANGAWASEARVYEAAQDMAQDVVRGVIFLLLLCVPFSFCMERLLIASSNVYKQITGTALVFCVMTAALWSFHPAFRLSSSPLIIVLAFAIILMSSVVIGVIYTKFDTELKRIRSGRGAGETTSFARASILASAVTLGIANMRKRRFRTALTSITIVLITFAVLCFTSASRYIGTTSLPTGVATSHRGIQLRQRGFRPMPGPIVSNVQAVIGDPKIRLVERWWNLSPSDIKEQVLITSDGVGANSKMPPGDSLWDGREGRSTPTAAQSAAPGGMASVAVQALLGLSPGESELSKIGEVIGGPKFARLENGETNVVYLSDQTASQLAVHEGDHVRIGGIELEIAGIFDSVRFDREVKTISGEPLAPLKYASGQLDAGGRRMDESTRESLDLDREATSLELGGAYEHLLSSQIAIVPAAISKMMPNRSLRSVAMKLPDESRVKDMSDELTRRFSLALFAGFDDGVRLVSASNLARVSGAGEIAIPLAIAGLIIFNTMMGSIAERKREIHVYTSLGLAPLHVGALFVAEALVYGLIGTVFGYIIGQAVGTLMLKLGWLGGATLNYSGTSAILTMGMILLIVLLSAIVPARMASKIAAPSIERTWKVPLPHGDQIIADLPFTINKAAADGALAYLAEFLDAHREGSIGKFSAGRIEPVRRDGARGLATDIWLTPFDLGIRQRLQLLIQQGEFPDIYDVQVILQRQSGDDRNWHRMNRTFLTELRKQFLQWRSLTPAKMREYIDRSVEFFA